MNDLPDSDDLDRILADDPGAGDLLAPRDIDVRLEVSVDAATLEGLTERATREGRDIGEVVADVLRSAAA
ncbi:ribbon-helix-helix protein, CopG family [Conexibacter sp. W3-3-2]|uniref:Uncharacterized protein n=1 Tax=Paraconexibacter algicola TaxID=2133960 RepID=A0A2T4UI66_9ACTN|nr:MULTISPECIES: ribbon-helix-helix protein, CopG family [Solirubrobacterales]MTD45217.1 ribbon-helix-helix protein, CopG family [Conexibacter sp. W3-3-2]PTL58918.1 hypothetical protein C7Y72_04260 [Paraconexibacter algicola]